MAYSHSSSAHLYGSSNQQLVQYQFEVYVDFCCSRCCLKHKTKKSFKKSLFWDDFFCFGCKSATKVTQSEKKKEKLTKRVKELQTNHENQQSQPNKPPFEKPNVEQNKISSNSVSIVIEPAYRWSFRPHIISLVLSAAQFRVLLVAMAHRRRRLRSATQRQSFFSVEAVTDYRGSTP